MPFAIWSLPTGGSPGRSLTSVVLDPPPADLNEASRRLPAGVYTTLRTFNRTQILPLDGHVRRLEESAALLGRPLTLSIDHLRAALGWAVRRFPAPESRLRISVDLEQAPGTVYLLLEPLDLPSREDYARGVLAVTVPFQRSNPRAKTTDFIELAEQARHHLPQGTNEALMLDPAGRILEGLSSNFFAVLNDELHTAGSGVLPGLVRGMVLESARTLGLPVRFEPVSTTDLPDLQEAFITSSSRLVLPVRQIDEQPVGTGQPGPVTLALTQACWERVRESLEELP